MANYTSIMEKYIKEDYDINKVFEDISRYGLLYVYKDDELVSEIPLNDITIEDNKILIFSKFKAYKSDTALNFDSFNNLRIIVNGNLYYKKDFYPHFINDYTTYDLNYTLIF